MNMTAVGDEEKLIITFGHEMQMMVYTCSSGHTLLRIDEISALFAEF